MAVFTKNCLDNKLIVISGAAGALGAVIIEKLTAHGAEVVAVDIMPKNRVSKNVLEKTDYIVCDVTNNNAVKELYSEIKKSHKKFPDVVICHAGIVNEYAIEDFPEEEWDRLMDINVKGSFLLAKGALKGMLGNHSFENPGKILFTTSWVYDVPWPKISAYNTSKAAIQMFMKSLAREYASKHIRSNALAPGQVATGMALDYYENNEEYRNRTKKSIPVGRMQPADSVAEGYLFLCSNASNYMTGSNIIIDGGNSLYPMI